MKKYLAGIAVVGLLALGNTAYASLVVSGTVEYDGAQRNLIYDDDLDITWLDYSKRGYLDGDNWYNQSTWAAYLSLTVNGVTYDNWRLPSAGMNPNFGYNQTTSELGHLYYIELGLQSSEDREYIPVSAAELNASVFDNLVSSGYWSGTEYVSGYPGKAWYLSMDGGVQGSPDKRIDYIYALAVMPGQISSVPEPASMLLIGSGLAGLVALKRRKK